MIIPTLKTRRLTLRAPSETDLDDEAEFFATERSKFVGGPLPRPQVWRAIAMMIGHWHLRGYGFWGVDDKETGEYFGRVGLWSPEGWPEPEIGWTVMGNAEGKGIAFEAAQVVRKYAYETLKWPTAISLVDPENTRSAKLAERMGCAYETSFEHETFGHMHVWRHPSAQELHA